MVSHWFSSSQNGRDVSSGIWYPRVQWSSLTVPFLSSSLSQHRVVQSHPTTGCSQAFFIERLKGRGRSTKASDSRVDISFPPRETALRLSRPDSRPTWRSVSSLVAISRASSAGTCWKTPGARLTILFLKRASFLSDPKPRNQSGSTCVNSFRERSNSSRELSSDSRPDGRVCSKFPTTPSFFRDTMPPKIPGFRLPNLFLKNFNSSNAARGANVPALRGDRGRNLKSRIFNDLSGTNMGVESSVILLGPKTSHSRSPHPLKALGSMVVILFLNRNKVLRELKGSQTSAGREAMVLPCRSMNCTSAGMSVGISVSPQ